MNTSGHKINPITTEMVITLIRYAMLYKIEKFSASSHRVIASHR